MLIFDLKSNERLDKKIALLGSISRKSGISDLDVWVWELFYYFKFEFYCPKFMAMRRI